MLIFRIFRCIINLCFYTHKRLTFVSMSGCCLQHLLTEVTNMKTKESKKATVEALDVMIQQVEKGPSGFWVEAHEGCGNPKIFPEFEEG